MLAASPLESILNIPIAQLLTRYEQRFPGERIVDRFYRLIAEEPHFLERKALAGHITASVWILGKSDDSALLTHHRKLGRWLQLGGHVDGDEILVRAALREASEESGLSRFEVALVAGALCPLDLDIHPIPARGSEPAHEHFDVRFLLRANPTEPLVVSAESHDLKWIRVTELAAYSEEESLLRLQRKSRLWLEENRIDFIPAELSV